MNIIKRQHKRQEMDIAGEMEQRRLFMKELSKRRSQNNTSLCTEIKTSIGPKWYQVLSVNQRRVLDTLIDMVQWDLVEGKPVRITKVLRILGITHCQLDRLQLLTAMYEGRNDPELVLSQLYFEMFEHDMREKVSSYDLNARILLSSIYYLGLKKIIESLEDLFKPDTIPSTPAKVKSKCLKSTKSRTAVSPYLEKIEAVLYEPAFPKRRPPLPLPQLACLNRYQDEEEPIKVKKRPVEATLRPPPKLVKRQYRTYCDELAGYVKFEPPQKARTTSHQLIIPNKGRSRKLNKLFLPENKKKVYGIDAKLRKKPALQQGLVAPKTGAPTSHYLISGVHCHGTKTYFGIGGMAFTPPDGDLIIRGHVLVNGKYIRINEGYRGHRPPVDTDTCSCMGKWEDSVFHYIKENKCHCEHFYDYGNEGTFPLDEPTYFDKSTPKSPFKFNQDVIYELDPKVLHLKKEFKRVWETESILMRPKDTQKKDKKKKKKDSSVNCLGKEPNQDDYLRCALIQLRREHLAARLPDIHLAPELKEWMHRRIHGDYTPKEKQEMFLQCIKYWNYLNYKALRKTIPDEPDICLNATTWKYKPHHQREFKNYVQSQKYKAYQTQAYNNNLLWASMCQTKFPDKRFREIFFCYFVSRVSEMHVVAPYSSAAAQNRRLEIKHKRRICLPDGVEDLDHD